MGPRTTGKHYLDFYGSGLKVCVEGDFGIYVEQVKSILEGWSSRARGTHRSLC